MHLIGLTNKSSSTKPWFAKNDSKEALLRNDGVEGYSETLAYLIRYINASRPTVHGVKELYAGAPPFRSHIEAQLHGRPPYQDNAVNSDNPVRPMQSGTLQPIDLWTDRLALVSVDPSDTLSLSSKVVLIRSRQSRTEIET